MFKEQLRVHIRWMNDNDVASVYVVEEANYEWDAFSEAQIHKYRRERNIMTMVVELCDRIVGFMIYELRSKSLRVIRFGVHPDLQRAGIGSLMMAKLVSKLSGHRRVGISIDAEEGDLRSHLFLRSQGFKAVRVTQAADQAAIVFHYGVVEDDDSVLVATEAGDEDAAETTGWTPEEENNQESPPF